VANTKGRDSHRDSYWDNAADPAAIHEEDVTLMKGSIDALHINVQ
jgi:hypothetical protein